MSLLPIRVDGTIHCQTTQQVERHAFSYTDATPSAAVASSEAASLLSLVDQLTAARNDSNRFFTSMIAKYPKGRRSTHSAEKGGRRKKRDDDDEDENAAEEETDDGPQLDSATTAHVTVPPPADTPDTAPSSSSNLAAPQPETKRAKLDKQ